MSRLTSRVRFERPVVGKIRYMSYGGCRAKFNLQAYMRRVRGIGAMGPLPASP